MTNLKLARKLAERVQLLDHDGTLLRMITAAEGETLLLAHRVEACGTKTRTRAVRYIEEDRSIYGGGLDRHQRTLAEPHRAETDDNVSGVWSFDRLHADPTVFLGVLRGVIRKAA